MGYGSVAESAMWRGSGRVFRSRLLAASVTLAAVVLLAGGAADVRGRRAELLQEDLYSIPNFVYQRTQTHFPEAEEGWLNQAAQGKIGDDVKPEKTLKRLNRIMSEARTHALTENYEARVKAKTLAMTENYDEYDVQKGKVVHKIYGGKAMGAAPTLKAPQPAALRGADMPQLAQPQVKGGMMMRAAPRAAINDMVSAELGGGAEGGARRQQQLAASHKGQAVAAAAAARDYEVQVPAGQGPGKMFLAKIPGGGEMLVQVPAGAAPGQWVAIKVPAALAAKPLAPARQAKLAAALQQRPAAAPHRAAAVGATEHPFADSMIAASIADHYRSERGK